MLTGDPNKRPSAGDALLHPWFTEHQVSTSEIVLRLDILQRLMSFKGVSKLKKAAMNMLVKTADPTSIKELRDQFEMMDLDRTGMITAAELKEAIKQNPDANLSDKEIENIINEIDYYGNKKINYSEFLTATIDLENFLTENKLNALFSQFDTDGSGIITSDNIITAMSKIGHKITQQELNEVMLYHDLKKDGFISK